MPVRCCLQRDAGMENLLLFAVPAHELHAYGHPLRVEATWQGKGWRAGQIERRRVALQLQDQLGLLSERANPVEAERREGLNGRQQQIHLSKRARNASRRACRRN